MSNAGTSSGASGPRLPTADLTATLVNPYGPGLYTAGLTIERDLHALGQISTQTRDLVRYLSSTSDLLADLMRRTARQPRPATADILRRHVAEMLLAECGGQLETASLTTAIIEMWMADIDWHTVAGYLIWVRANTRICAEPPHSSQP